MRAILILFWLKFGRVCPNNFFQGLPKSIGIYLFLTIASNLGNNVKAQNAAIDLQKDSLSKLCDASILYKQFLIAGEYYKIKKYKLNNYRLIQSDSFMQSLEKEYRRQYQQLDIYSAQYFFTENFYIEVIPIVQQYRNAAFVSLLMEHSNQLYPKPKVPDPKHDKEHRHSEEDHSHH